MYALGDGLGTMEWANWIEWVGNGGDGENLIGVYGDVSHIWGFGWNFNFMERLNIKLEQLLG